MSSENPSLNSELVRTIQIQKLDPINPLDRKLVRYDVFQFMQDQGLPQIYGEFNQWYTKKVVPGFVKKERIIHIATDMNQIYGSSITKISPTETKLCTLVVEPKNRRKGIGTKLLQQTLEAAKDEVINTQYPSTIIATVSEGDSQASKIDFFSALYFLEDFGFELIDIMPNKYREGNMEYVLSAHLL